LSIGLIGSPERVGDGAALRRRISFNVATPAFESFVSQVFPSDRTIAEYAHTRVDANMFYLGDDAKRGVRTADCGTSFVRGVNLSRAMTIAVSAEFKSADDARRLAGEQPSPDLFSIAARENATRLGIHVIQLAGTKDAVQTVLDQSKCRVDDVEACRATLEKLRELARGWPVAPDTDLDWGTFRNDWSIGSVDLASYTIFPD
jgi:hypothetical protein